MEEFLHILPTKLQNAYCFLANCLAKILATYPKYPKFPNMLTMWTRTREPAVILFNFFFSTQFYFIHPWHWIFFLGGGGTAFVRFDRGFEIDNSCGKIEPRGIDMVVGFTFCASIFTNHGFVSFVKHSHSQNKFLYQFYFHSSDFERRR